MSEWGELGNETDREFYETSERRRALRPFGYDLTRLHLAKRSPLPPLFHLDETLPSFEELSAEIDRLVAEGRKGAARKRLRKALHDFDRYVMQRMDKERDIIILYPYVEMSFLAKRLAELDDADAAAVTLAKHSEKIIANLGLDSDAAKEALKVIAQTVEPVADSPQAVVPPVIAAADVVHENGVAEDVIKTQRYTQQGDAEE